MSVALHIVAKKKIKGFDPFFLVDEGMEDEVGGDFPKEEWFNPEGLATVKAMIAHLTQNPEALTDSGKILEGLRKHEQVLATLAQHQVKWHLAIDY